MLAGQGNGAQTVAGDQHVIAFGLEQFFADCQACRLIINAKNGCHDARLYGLCKSCPNYGVKSRQDIATLSGKEAKFAWAHSTRLRGLSYNSRHSQHKLAKPATPRGPVLMKKELCLSLFLLTVRLWAAGNAPPNVFLITIDTLRADHVGCYGYSGVKTPAIDGLA